MATKFQENTIISLGGQATYRSNGSQELADEMVDGWCHLMTRFFDRPDATAAFLEQAASLSRIDDCNVTSSISPDDVGAALTTLKREKTATWDTNEQFILP